MIWICRTDAVLLSCFILKNISKLKTKGENVQNDLEYYTYTEKFLEKTSLEEFAQIYNTDVETLQILNPETIFIEAGNYYVISDTLVVPKFITQEELQVKKESTKQYQ